MREKIVLGTRAVPLRVTLPNGTSVSRYERISRKNLLGNVSVLRTQTIGPRIKQQTKAKQKKVKFALANKPTQGQKNKKIYRKLCDINQTGNGLVSTLANLRLQMGSKATNSVLGKKIIDKGIENITNLGNYGTSKINNDERALNSDITNYVVEKAQNKMKDRVYDLLEQQKMSRGTSNFQTNKPLKKLEMMI